MVKLKQGTGYTGLGVTRRLHTDSWSVRHGKQLTSTPGSTLGCHGPTAKLAINSE